MSRIDVVTDGEMFKIMVNFERRHVYSTAITANKIAKSIKEEELPLYELNLLEV